MPGQWENCSVSIEDVFVKVSDVKLCRRVLFLYAFYFECIKKSNVGFLMAHCLNKHVAFAVEEV